MICIHYTLDSFWFGTYYLISWLWSMWCLAKGGLTYFMILKDYRLLSRVWDPPFTWTIYAMYEAAHYTTCTFYYFFDSRQNHTDFWMMLGHHVAVLSLSYICLRFPQFDYFLALSYTLLPYPHQISSRIDVFTLHPRSC